DARQGMPHPLRGLGEGQAALITTNGLVPVATLLVHVSQTHVRGGAQLRRRADVVQHSLVAGFGVVQIAQVGGELRLMVDEPPAVLGSQKPVVLISEVQELVALAVQAVVAGTTEQLLELPEAGFRRRANEMEHAAAAGGLGRVSLRTPRTLFE